MRSLARSISAVGLLAATSIAGCGTGGEDLETETRLGELQISQASSGVITDDQSYVRADVVPVNQSNFALLYQHAADGMLHLVQYTIPAPGTQPAVVQNPGQWNLGVDGTLNRFTRLAQGPRRTVDRECRFVFLAGEREQLICPLRGLPGLLRELVSLQGRAPTACISHVRIRLLLSNLDLVELFQLPCG